MTFRTLKKLEIETISEFRLNSDTEYSVTGRGNCRLGKNREECPESRENTCSERTMAALAQFSGLSKERESESHELQPTTVS